jgi:aryl-alcohol dehydrogenase-like predicted oxidoreductase
MITEALGIQRALGMDRFISCQPRYNLLARDIERDVLPVCERHELGILPWSPLAAGFLSGKYRRGETPTSGRWSVHPYNKQFESLPDWHWDTVEKVEAIADERGCEPAQVACAWLLSRQAVSSVLGGANSKEQMASYIGAADIELTADEVAALDGLSEAPKGPWPPRPYRTA